MNQTCPLNLADNFLTRLSLNVNFTNIFFTCSLHQLRARHQAVVVHQQAVDILPPEADLPETPLRHPLPEALLAGEQTREQHAVSGDKVGVRVGGKVGKGVTTWETMGKCLTIILLLLLLLLLNGVCIAGGNCSFCLIFF